MKRNIIVFYLFFLLSISTFAQFGGIIGLKSGFSSANQYGPDFSLDSKSRNALSYGAFFNIFIEQNLGLMTELSKAPAGYKLVDKNNNYSMSNNYLIFSFAPQYYFMDQGFMLFTGPYINAGLYASYLLSSKIDGYRDGITYDRFVLADDYRSFDYGISLGCGFSLVGALSLGFEYYRGLGRITDDKIRNRFWNISLYIGLPSDADFGD